MHLGDACLFGLRHFFWALQVFVLTALAMACGTNAELESALQFYAKCLSWVLLIGAYTMAYWLTGLYASLTSSEMCQLGLFHALTTLIFIHYLKMYFHFCCMRATSRLRFAAELFGIALLLSTFLGTWSTGLVIYFYVSDYYAQNAANGGL